MALFGSERGIGRGETPESRIEAPFFAGFMFLCAAALMVSHFLVQNDSITVAVAVSMLVFGLSMVRPDLGVSVLVVAMLLSPEIESGPVGSGERLLNLRYDDVMIIVTFLGVLARVVLSGEPLTWLPSPINSGIVFYYGVCVISCLQALRLDLVAWDKITAVFVMLKMLEFYLLFWVTGKALTSLRDVRRQLTLFFMVALIVIGYCLYTRGIYDRVTAPFEKGGAEPNTLGGYLILVICVAAGLATQTQGWWRKALYWGLAGVACAPFLLTLSRASYVGLVSGVIALSFLARRGWIFALVVLFLVLSPLYLPEEVLDRVNYTFQRGAGQPLRIGDYDTGLQVDKSTYERVYVWQKVRYNLRVWPWFGGGVGWESVLDSHYARVIIETGVLGLASFLFLQYRVYRTTRQAFRWSTDRFAKGLAVGASAATVGLVVHSLGTITFLIVRIMEPFWLIVALTAVARHCAVMEYLARKQRQGASARGDEPAGQPPTAAAGLTTETAAA